MCSWPAQLQGNLQIYSLIWDHSPHLPYHPNFQNVKFEACAIQIVVFKPNLTTKEKLSRSHRESRWGSTHRMGSRSGNTSERESTGLAPGVGDICALTGGQSKLEWAGPQLHSSHRIKIIPMFWEGLMSMAALLFHWSPMWHKSKIALLIICHQTISWEESREPWKIL